MVGVLVAAFGSSALGNSGKDPSVPCLRIKIETLRRGHFLSNRSLFISLSTTLKDPSSRHADMLA